MRPVVAEVAKERDGDRLNEMDPTSAILPIVAGSRSAWTVPTHSTRPRPAGNKSRQRQQPRRHSAPGALIRPLSWSRMRQRPSCPSCRVRMTSGNGAGCRLRGASASVATDPHPSLTLPSWLRASNSPGAAVGATDFRRDQQPGASPRPPHGPCRRRSIGSASGLPFSASSTSLPRVHESTYSRSTIPSSPDD